MAGAVRSLQAAQTRPLGCGETGLFAGANLDTIGRMAGRVSIAWRAKAEDQSRLLQEVAGSECFAKAPALRKLLSYLWEHREVEIAEYAIAMDVLGKRPDFDPKTDASVRVHISRLRQKLREYFDDEGRHQPLRIVIPQGSHTLRLEEAAPEPRREIWWRWLKLAWAPSLALVLACLCGYLWYDSAQARAEVAKLQGTLELPPVWKAILKPGRLTRIVYPIPVFYHWDTLRMRDVRVNHPEGWRTSEVLRPYVEQLGPPTISQSYTVSTDTMAAIQLTRFLSSHGRALEVGPTGSLSLDQYGSDNLIFLGIPPTNEQLTGYVEKLNFRLQGGSGTVTNRHPAPGEVAEFRPMRGSPERGGPESYGVIAVLKGHAAGTSLIVVTGMQTSAIATLLTSPKGIDDFTGWWRKAGSPAHFEAVVRTVATGVTTKAAEVAALRPIR